MKGNEERNRWLVFLVRFWSGGELNNCGAGFWL